MKECRLEFELTVAGGVEVLEERSTSILTAFILREIFSTDIERFATGSMSRRGLKFLLKLNNKGIGKIAITFSENLWEH